jgi:hypothetical protein
MLGDREWRILEALTMFSREIQDSSRYLEEN